MASGKFSSTKINITDNEKYRKKALRLTEALFADDTTLYDEKDEMVHGKEIFKSSMRSFEEQCHGGKEEHLALGTQEGREIRMLGTWVGRRHAVEQRKKGEDMP